MELLYFYNPAKFVHWVISSSVDSLCMQIPRQMDHMLLKEYSPELKTRINILSPFYIVSTQKLFTGLRSPT